MVEDPDDQPPRTQQDQTPEGAGDAPVILVPDDNSDTHVVVPDQKTEDPQHPKIIFAARRRRRAFDRSDTL